MVKLHPQWLAAKITLGGQRIYAAGIIDGLGLDLPAVVIIKNIRIQVGTGRTDHLLHLPGRHTPGIVENSQRQGIQRRSIITGDKITGAHIVADKVQLTCGRRYPAVIIVIRPRQPFIVAAGSRGVVRAIGCQVLVVAAVVRIGQQPGIYRG